MVMEFGQQLSSLRKRHSFHKNKSEFLSMWAVNVEIRKLKVYGQSHFGDKFVRRNKTWTKVLKYQPLKVRNE